MNEGNQYVIRMDTDKGAFYWDSESIYVRVRNQTYGAFRPWGWLEDINQAQRYQLRANAIKTARTLYTELARLYTVRLNVLGVAPERSLLRGTVIDEADLWEIG